jgi:hypothetical protein
VKNLLMCSVALRALWMVAQMVEPHPDAWYGAIDAGFYDV